MGVLTEETRRLCQSIAGLRSERRAMLTDVARENRGRKVAVSALCAELASHREERARQSKANLLAFLSGLRGAVAAQQRAFRADRAGAQRAWEGGRRAVSAVVVARREALPEPAHPAPPAPRKGSSKRRPR